MPQAQDVITLKAGRFVLDAPLAQSAYGLVWRARDGEGRAAALKFINQAQMAQAPASLHGRWVDSAQREAAFLASLAPWDERHIVRLLDFGQHGGLPVMALELMGPDLARHLEHGTDLAISQVLDWTGQVNQALAKVHQYGWLYLDLKPANVLTASGGGVKLADFGTSRLRSQGPSTHYSGTASWQAPEQFVARADGSYEVSEATDFFALGALFYYLVTGGAQLRFCLACGAAYRDGGQPPAARLANTLMADEEQRFLRSFNARSGGAEATWCPAGDSQAGTLALALLRSLLAPDPRQRPSHALAVSRELAAIRHARRNVAPIPPARGAAPPMRVAA